MQQELKPILTEVKTIGERTSKAMTRQDKALGKFAERLEELEAKASYPLDQGGPLFGRDPGENIGKTIAEAEQVKSFIAGNSQSARVEIDRKAITTPTANISQPARMPGIVAPKEAPLTLRALLQQTAITSLEYEWPAEASFVNGADYQVNEGDLKAESDIQLTLNTARAHTLAHWVVASKQVLADAAGLGAYIDMRLIFGIEQKAEVELLFGGGGGSAIHGLMPQAPAFAGTAGDSQTDQIRRAITQIRKVGGVPSAIVMAEEDWETIELKRDGEGRYELPGLPSDCADSVLWKTPVVPCASMPPGQFLVGDLARSAILLEREALTVEVSREDGDNFRRNMCTILAEERLGLAVVCPSLLRAGTFA